MPVKIHIGPSTEYLRHSRRGILVKRSEKRSEEEIQTLKRLKTVHRVTERCCTLFEQFAGMLRDKEQRSEEQITRNWKSGQSKPKHPGSPI